MARKKSTENKEEILLTKEEVWSVLEFSRALVQGMYPSVLSPDILNARLKDISYSPTAISQTDLDNALANPKNSEETLRNFIEHLELISMPLKRIFSYMASHLAMDLLYTVTNAEPKDYKSPKFKKDQTSIYDYFDRFDYKHYFRNAIKQMLRNELYVATVREDGQRIVLQELPLQYIRITARWDYGLLASFDFSYFLQSGIDLDLYHPFFKKKFNELFVGNNKISTYNPSLPIELRGNSQYALWVDLPPEVAWVFKLDTSLITAVPYFSGLMPDLMNQSVMRTLQKDINMASASKMLFGQVPLLKDTKASVKDMIAIDPKTLGQFLNLVKSSVSSAIKIGSAPLEDMQAISFEGNDELYDKWLRTALASSGMDTALIYSSMLKANLVDSQLSFQSDSKIMEQQLYPQFESFLNYWGNRRVKNFKYNFKLEGNDYYLDRQQRFDRAMQLATQGIVLPQLFSSSLGLKPQELYRMLEESKAIKFAEDWVTPIIPGSQMAGGIDGSGRPTKSDSEISESGAETKSSGGNVGRGGK